MAEAVEDRVDFDSVAFSETVWPLMVASSPTMTEAVDGVRTPTFTPEGELEPKFCWSELAPEPSPTT